MKKTLIIGGSVIVILILLLLWGYLFVFGTPDSAEEVYANLGFSQTSPSDDAPVPTLPPEPREPVADEPSPRPPLRQITTEPVIGFQPVATTSTTTPPTILYAAADAGHIFHYSSITGERDRLSNISIPRAQVAHFSPDGQWGAVVSHTVNNLGEVGKMITVIDLRVGDVAGNGVESAESATTTNSGPTAREIQLHDGWYDNFSISEEYELLYTVSNNGLTLGRALSLPTNTERTLFTVPFSEVKVLWGSSGADTHYVYNSPAPGLESFLYQASPSGLSRLPVSGQELSVMRDGDTLVYSSKEEGLPRASFHRDHAELTPVALPIIREKCTFHTSPRIICGQDTNEPVNLHNWYLGRVRHDDWFAVASAGNLRRSDPLLDLFTESGRMVDVMHLTSDTTHDILYFQNKRDGMLWLYEL